MVENELEVLRDVSSRLESAGIAFMLTGSLALNYYEDLILSKLYWAKESRSDLQLGDVRNLLAPECDLDYLRSRARMLGVEPLFEEVQSRNE